MVQQKQEEVKNDFMGSGSFPGFFHMLYFIFKQVT